MLQELLDSNDKMKASTTRERMATMIDPEDGVLSIKGKTNGILLLECTIQ